MDQIADVAAENHLRGQPGPEGQASNGAFARLGRWTATHLRFVLLAWLVVLVVFCTVIAYTLMNRWQRHVSATEAGLIYCIEPVIASVLALFLPGWLSHWSDINYANEQLTLRLLLGGGLITVANVLLQSRWLEPRRVES